MSADCEPEMRFLKHFWRQKRPENGTSDHIGFLISFLVENLEAAALKKRIASWKIPKYNAGGNDLETRP